MSDLEDFAAIVGADIKSLRKQTTYVHTQGATSSSWVISHNMGKNPSVTVVDSSGSVVEGSITFNNLNTLTIVFSAAFQGSAFLN